MSDLLLLTDRRQTRLGLLPTVAQALVGGARTVVLRERDLPPPHRLALAEALRDLLAPVGGRLIVAGPDPLGGDAVHLAARDPWPTTPVALVGRSCHDAAELAGATGGTPGPAGVPSPAELAGACTATGARRAADYVTLSPVFASASKPGYGPALGVSGLAELAANASVSIFALGGVESPDRAGACAQSGVAGIAVMGAVMRAIDPAAVVARLLTGWAAGVAA